jgi:hypothetical protein
MSAEVLYTLVVVMTGSDGSVNCGEFADQNVLPLSMLVQTRSASEGELAENRATLSSGDNNLPRNGLTRIVWTIAEEGITPLQDDPTIDVRTKATVNAD